METNSWKEQNLVKRELISDGMPYSSLYDAATVFPRVWISVMWRLVIITREIDPPTGKVVSLIAEMDHYPNI